MNGGRTEVHGIKANDKSNDHWKTRRALLFTTPSDYLYFFSRVIVTPDATNESGANVTKNHSPPEKPRSLSDPVRQVKPYIHHQATLEDKLLCGHKRLDAL
ncbi:hypothetical protein RRG08_008880 [Elysia crispata]|uniref:Uncharacterized protein n=1 Tax=Elysia crispata TaxID=231223 RepID=A0AAE0ZY11_9GAST|nr:hypothetical protein RRG08_008880 [Elysia crispata]